MTEELAVQKTNKKFNLSALISMVSGILSYALLLFHSLIDMKMILALFLAPITALIAIFTGGHAKRQIRKSNGLVSGKKMANAGLWMGWIYIIGIILLTVLAVVIFGGIVSGINSLLGSIGIG
jgi:hypothetical protein